MVSEIKWIFAIPRMCSVSTEGGTIFLKELGKDQHNRVFEKILSPKGFDVRREEEFYYDEESLLVKRGDGKVKGFLDFYAGPRA